MIRVAGTALLLFALPIVSIAADTKMTPTNVAACRAAFSADDYPLLPISNEIQQIIASYRAQWRQFCSGDDQSVALDTLFSEALTVEQEFEHVFQRLWEEPQGDPGDRGDEVHQALSVSLPSFVPAFFGWYMEYAQFRPLLVDFREASALGTKEDVRFFQAYTPLHGDTGIPPWIQLETDVTGCVRFGQYDWVAALKTAADLRKETKSEIYRKLIDRFESDLLEAVSEDGVGQACGDAQDVLPDLLAVRDYVKSRNAAVTKAIEHAIDAIRAGSTAVR